MKAIRGVVRGRSIELAERTGLTDGQAVEATVAPLRPDGEAWGDGIRRSAGGWANDDGIDAVMAEVAGDRKRERRPQ